MGNLFTKIASARKAGVARRGGGKTPEEVYAEMQPGVLRAADVGLEVFEHNVEPEVARAVADLFRAEGVRVAVEVWDERADGQSVRRAKLHVSLRRPHVVRVTRLGDAGTPQGGEVGGGR